MTEDEATRIVRQIEARPTSAAFDCAAGAIVRLFAAFNELRRRLAFVERRVVQIDQLERRLAALERAAGLAHPSATVPKVNGQAGDDDEFRIPEGELVGEPRIDRRHQNPGRQRGTKNKPGHRAGRPVGSRNQPGHRAGKRPRVPEPVAAL
jgi:hypothetical protein